MEKISLICPVLEYSLMPLYDGANFPSDYIIKNEKDSHIGLNFYTKYDAIRARSKLITAQSFVVGFGLLEARKGKYEELKMIELYDWDLTHFVLCHKHLFIRTIIEATRICSKRYIFKFEYNKDWVEWEFNEYGFLKYFRTSKGWWIGYDVEDRDIVGHIGHSLNDGATEFVTLK